MRAFLLAAGEGRRLRPLTATTPKCLVPIRGVPLLGIWLDLLDRHGVSRVLVNVHHLHDRVLEFLRRWPTRVKVETVHERRLLGSAGTVFANRDFVMGEESFLILYADNLTNVDLTDMVAFHRRRSEILTLGVTPTDRPKEKGTVRLGPAGQIVEFAEKSPTPPSNLASAGVYVARQDIFDFIPGSARPDGVVDFGFDVLPRLVPDVAAYQIYEFLMDVGSPETYSRAQVIWPGLQEPSQPACAV